VSWVVECSVGAACSVGVEYCSALSNMCLVAAVGAHGHVAAVATLCPATALGTSSDALLPPFQLPVSIEPQGSCVDNA
jgi:hypothetical protein